MVAELARMEGTCQGLLPETALEVHVRRSVGSHRLIRELYISKKWRVARADLSPPCEFSHWDFLYCREEGERFAIQGRIMPLSKPLKAFGIVLFSQPASFPSSPQPLTAAETINTTVESTAPMRTHARVR